MRSPYPFLIILFAFLLPLHSVAHSGDINLPPGFKATVIADNIGMARQLAIRENGDIYVGLLNDKDLNYLVAMRDTDNDGTMDVIKYFGEVGSLVKSIKIYDDYLYVGASTQVVRYKLHPTELLPKELYEVIVTGFPPPRSHPSKNIAFDNEGNLYVSAGAPSNSCQEDDRAVGSPGKSPCDELEWGAGIWKFDANTLNQMQLVDGELVATGVRNAVAIDFDLVKNQLYTLSNGRDGLHQLWGSLYNARDSAENPSEQFQMIQDGDDYGWPYAYWDEEEDGYLINPEYGGDGKIRAKEGDYTKPIYAFPGHWAPTGLKFYHDEQFPEKYRGGAFIAFHGSWNRAPLPQQGYNVVYVPFDGKLPSGPHEEFVNGFSGVTMLMTPDSAKYRPTGLEVGPDGSLYITEDVVGRIWKVEYTGDTSQPVIDLASTSLSSTPKTVLAKRKNVANYDAEGQAIYNQYCLACHQMDGSGVPNVQPSLINSTRLTEDDDFLIKLTLLGSEWMENRKYQNVMTKFSYLSNQDISAVLNYSKVRFTNSDATISAEGVAEARDSLKDTQ
tara:strand:- start:6919 stop:8589 length:1671 start_codon:yes stop_codon:yes gene_type:complete